MSDQANRSERTVKVFGSSIVRAAPDTASIVVAVSRLEMDPKKSFAKARAVAGKVHACLESAAIKDVDSSRITLAQQHRYEKNEHRFAGYLAKLEYNIVLRDLDRVEGLLADLIDAGVNELTSVNFETSRLKEIRADARRRAFNAARAKAEIYAEPAGVTVGDVLLIEDVNPEFLSGREGHGHVQAEPRPDDAGELKAVDPGAITVGGAVNVTFELKG